MTFLPGNLLTTKSLIALTDPNFGQFYNIFVLNLENYLYMQLKLNLLICKKSTIYILPLSVEMRSKLLFCSNIAIFVIV